MFIQTEATPNPTTMKFLPGKPVSVSSPREFKTKEEAEKSSPLAKRLLAVEGVTSVFLGSDFISVTKDATDWQHLKPTVLGAIMEHYLSEEPAIIEQTSEEPEQYSAEDTEIITTIKELIETRVRPAVANDGGDIVFHSFKDGVVYLKMHGACAGCPSSTATLRYGIENLLKHFVPEVLEVQAV